MDAQFVVLAAGYGSRLRPLTDNLPKPLLPWRDTTALHRALDLLMAAGWKRGSVNAYHLAEKLIGTLPASIHLSEETEILGTAGGIRQACLDLSKPCLVWNGDMIGSPPLAELREHCIQLDAPILLTQLSQGKGAVVSADDGWLTGIRDFRSSSHGEGQAQLNYLGVAMLPPSFLQELPLKGCLVGDALIPYLSRGGRVFCLRSDERFWDMGTLADYLDSQLDEEAAKIETERFPGCIVKKSYLGRNVEILGEGLIEEVIAWPGATVHAPLSRAVVLSDGSIVAVETSRHI